MHSKILTDISSPLKNPFFVVFLILGASLTVTKYIPYSSNFLSAQSFQKDYNAGSVKNLLIIASCVRLWSYFINLLCKPRGRGEGAQFINYAPLVRDAKYLKSGFHILPILPNDVRQ